jgi:hopene-associated glycosyltransferase HpnB
MFDADFLGIATTILWTYMATGHGEFWRPFTPSSFAAPAALPSVDIIVPARNEAEVLPFSLPSLLQQNYAGPWRVILVDDHSQDGTGDLGRQIARGLGADDRLTVLQAPELLPGWSGKVAAMNAGVGESRADFVLFTDADIEHDPSSLRHLVARAEAGKLDLVSRMVLLNCVSVAEKLLIPAFVFFFAMLYPFKWSNDPSARTAAAAGGTMLVRRSRLTVIGGLASIRSALIDDCSLAQAIKSSGGRTELLLTQEIRSLRPYPSITDVWRMVARTAYTQLRYRPLFLVGTVLGLGFMYILPIWLFLFAPTFLSTVAGLLSCAVMVLIYRPIVKFYSLSWVWTLTLPIAALIYGMATVDSARLYYAGKGGLWKGRAQA